MKQKTENRLLKRTGEKPAKKGRVILLVLIGAFVVSAGCGLAEYRYTGDKTYTEEMDLAGIDTVVMQLGSADVKIKSGESALARFEIKKSYRASSKKYIDEILHRTRIVFEKRGSQLIVKQESEKGSSLGSFARGHVRVRIIAYLPQIPLEISTGSGDVRVDHWRKDLRIFTGSGDGVVDGAQEGFSWRSGSGDIHLGSASGKVNISTGSGDVTISEIEGEFECSCGSGDVLIGHIEGGFSIATGSGDIVIDESIGDGYIRASSGDVTLDSHKGDAEVSTTSGEITVATYPAPNEIRLKSSSGDIQVVLYGDSVTLDVATTSGAITARVPIVVKEARREHLVGIGGDGLLKLRILTSSGDVTVRQGTV